MTAVAGGDPDPVRLEFWYEFASPHFPLAAARIERLVAGTPIELAWRPFLLGPIFKRRAHDASPFQNPSPAQRRYRWRDVERLCTATGRRAVLGQ